MELSERFARRARFVVLSAAIAVALWMIGSGPVWAEPIAAAAV